MLFQALPAWLQFIFVFIIKSEPLVGETLVEIESTVAKQTKNCDFLCFKRFFSPLSKGYLRIHFGFSFEISINIIIQIALNS